MGIEFTAGQQQVIRLRNRNILVSAAAGSGKTAVLVERILTMILDPERPVDIDRLLIVTFTNAAAGEMRERIGAAIESRLQQHPENVHLQRQATLLHNAQITTIDSFCLFVIRNHFHEIGLDPGFRVADSGEIALLEQEVLEELLEELLQEGEENSHNGKREEVIRLMEILSPSGSGSHQQKVLMEAILKVFRFAESFPWPQIWLKERYGDYRALTPDEIGKTEWGKLLFDFVREELEGVEERLTVAREICLSPQGPLLYLEAIEGDLAIVQRLKEASPESIFPLFETMAFLRFSSKKQADADPDRKAQVKALRDEGKERLLQLKKTYFSSSLAVLCRRMEEMQRTLETLIDTVLLFREKFAAGKREKGILDFGDMEHMALQILTETKEEDGIFSWRPGKAAVEYRKYFHEIMIDEYQDSNLVQEYLLQSISGEEEGRYNRFMVGDLKQSIYRFRLARPEIFLEKYRTYERGEDHDCRDINDGRDASHDGRKLPDRAIRCQKIDLHQNFRSRPQVLTGINDIFRQIMGENLGGVEYDERAALYAGAVYPESEADYTPLLLLAGEAGEKEEAEAADSPNANKRRRREAEMVAAKVLEMVDQFPVKDEAGDGLRPARFSDMVVLLRTTVGWEEEFADVFREYGIPVSLTSKTGYFTAGEVQLMLNFLRIIDNPRQDIPMYGLLKSLAGRWQEEEIVRLKCIRGETYFDKMTNVSQTEEGEDFLKQKACKMLEWIEKYRLLVPVTPIHRLLRRFLQETGYLCYFLGTPGGEQKVANVKMLLEKAKAYEKTGYYGVFHFIRYMEQLQKYEYETGEAGIEESHRDVLRIMSIHKSKGLEFPICFVSGLAGKFHRQDMNQPYVCDVDLGIGLDYRSPERRIRCRDLRKQLIGQKMHREDLGEELRLLYVAMTRAKEKLIMTGTVADYEETMAAYAFLKDRKERKLPAFLLRECSSFLEFLLPALVRMQDSVTVSVERDIRVKQAALARDVRRQEKKMAFTRQFFGLPLPPEKKQRVDALAAELEGRFHFLYQHKELEGLYAKTTVSEMKLAAMEEQEEGVCRWYGEEEIIPYIPEFMRQQRKVSGARRGTAYHKVLELLSPQGMDSLESLEKALLEKEKAGTLPPEYRELVNLKKLLRFYTSPLAGRMAVAESRGRLHKEQPFVLGIPAGPVQQSGEAEKVLMQGMIDVYFEEEGELVLVDYKTDAVQEQETLIERYRVQLDYYTKALEQLTGKKVRERILYSFALGEAIVC